MLCTFGFVDYTMFAHNRPNKNEASRAYCQRDSSGAAPGAKSDICDCVVVVSGLR